MLLLHHWRGWSSYFLVTWHALPPSEGAREGGRERGRGRGRGGEGEGEGGKKPVMRAVQNFLWTFDSAQSTPQQVPLCQSAATSLARRSGLGLRLQRFAWLEP